MFSPKIDKSSIRKFGTNSSLNIEESSSQGDSMKKEELDQKIVKNEVTSAKIGNTSVEKHSNSDDISNDHDGNTFNGVNSDKSVEDKTQVRGSNSSGYVVTDIDTMDYFNALEEMSTSYVTVDINDEFVENTEDDEVFDSELSDIERTNENSIDDAKDDEDLNKLKELFNKASDFVKTCFLSYLNSEYIDLMAKVDVDDIDDVKDIGSKDVTDVGDCESSEDIENNEDTTDVENVNSEDVKTEDSNISDGAITPERNVESTEKLDIKVNEANDIVDSNSSSQVGNDIQENGVNNLDEVETTDTGDSNASTDVISMSGTDSEDNIIINFDDKLDNSVEDIVDDRSLTEIFCETEVFEKREFLKGLFDEIGELLEYLKTFDVKLDTKIVELEQKRRELYSFIESYDESEILTLVSNIREISKTYKELENLQVTVKDIIKVYIK